MRNKKCPPVCATASYPFSSAAIKPTLLPKHDFKIEPGLTRCPHRHCGLIVLFFRYLCPCRDGHEHKYYNHIISKHDDASWSNLCTQRPAKPKGNFLREIFLLNQRNFTMLTIRVFYFLLAVHYSGGLVAKLTSWQAF